MKTLKNIFLLAIVSVFAIACEDREDFKDLPSADYRYVGIVQSRLSNNGQVFEGTGSATASIDVPLFYYNNNEAASITFTAGGDAQIGVDYNLEGVESVSGSTFVVALPTDTAATSFSIVPVSNDTQNANKTIQLEITGLPEGMFAGAPVSASQDIIILDDDCPYDFDRFVGSASVIENGTVGPYAINAIETAPNTIQVDNFWDSGIIATFVLVPCDGSVQVPAQSTPAFGDPDGNIVGSGTWDDETGELVVDVTISFPAFNFVSIEQHVYSF
ncbi:MAG: hypothetical protein HRT61_16400 [Ekhidna sp.]|nr:hypothetical protein [Ekhidna sp.]